MSYKIHLEKKGIRALGIAESFHTNSMKKSVLAGVVIRSDLIIDKFTFGSVTLRGDDATDIILDMYLRLKRSDINVIILGGSIISLYNMIDINQIGLATELPIISVTFEKSHGLEETIKHHFTKERRNKLKTYSKLGNRDKIFLQTGHSVFIRSHGIDLVTSKQVLDKFTIQGAIPEPIRLAKLLARAKKDLISR